MTRLATGACALFLFVLASCAGLVGAFEGHGDVWVRSLTDGSRAFAVGSGTMEVGTMAPGGVPVTVPYSVEEGMVYFKDGDNTWHQAITDPWPSWVRDLIAESDIVEIEQALGVDITIGE